MAASDITLIGGDLRNIVSPIALSRQTVVVIKTIRTVNVDIPGKQVHVDFDERVVDVDRMKDILEQEDYPVEPVA